MSGLRKKFLIMMLALLLSLGASHSVYAASVADGVRAYERHDYRAALDAWLPLAERGNARAANNVGLLYQNGLGVKQDYGQALAWYRKAAGNRSTEALNNIGVLYDTGHGVRQDYAEAAQWYGKAAKRGFAEAQYNLGAMYLGGQGVGKNTGEAAAWFRKAANQGNVKAQFNSGALCASRGDDANAYMWFTLAAEGGDKNASRRRNALASKMSSHDREEADELVRRWKQGRR
jgi:uncharacterized protein